jgi:hypothetical protein
MEITIIGWDYILEIVAIIPFIKRPAGKTASYRMYENQLLNMILILIIDYIYGEESEECDDDDSSMLDFAFFCIAEVYQINQPHLITPRRIPRSRISFDSFYLDEYEELFGFKKVSCMLLYDTLGFPTHLTIGSGHHSFDVDSIYCFLYL